jgi:hypothetical protein
MIDLAEAGDPCLLSILRKHPHVARVDEAPLQGVRFRQGSWQRSVGVGQPGLEVAGLVELMDNNPLVCADTASVPDAASTLALIALGPLVRAGLLAESPTVLVNVPGDAALLGAFLAKEGWPHGATLASEEMDFGTVCAATVIAAILTPDRLEDIDDLYEEAYGRSFFVSRDEESEWDVKLVKNQPFALFRLRIAADNPQSLLTVQVMADQNGKCGPAQVVHCMNVMAGFEETIGIA